jgi:3-hydroxyisobutyrate dehydrogenase-like beta-hydroxyacid dehydrogenase
MKVGWIGLGQMGGPMAEMVLKGGHQVVGHSRGRRPLDRLTALGARLTPSLTEAVAGAEVVCVSLFDDAQTREALLGGGVLAAMAPGSVLALHSTGVPAMVEDLAAAAPPGVSVLDATFSGTPADAAVGEVRLFVGGDADALERARPVLSTYCSPILHLGEVGAARRLKLINNLLFAAQVSLAAEAVRAVMQMGLPKDKAVEGLSISSGSSFALQRFVGADIDSLLTRLAHYLDKDVTAAREAAKAEGLDLKLLDAAAARWTKPKAPAA